MRIVAPLTTTPLCTAGCFAKNNGANFKFFRFKNVSKLCYNFMIVCGISYCSGLGYPPLEAMVQTDRNTDTKILQIIDKIGIGEVSVKTV